MKSDVTEKVRDIVAGLIVVAVLTGLDQYTKVLAARYLPGRPVEIIKGVFKLQYLQNTGAAFGLFSNQMIFFYVITVAFLALAVFFYLRAPRGRRFLPLRIIALFLMAGALGNFIDRVSFRYVRDFLYFCLIDFPIFNVADIYVTCSAAAIFALMLWFYKDPDLDELEKAIRLRRTEEEK